MGWHCHRDFLLNPSFVKLNPRAGSLKQLSLQLPPSVDAGLFSHTDKTSSVNECKAEIISMCANMASGTVAAKIIKLISTG
jgi:hypothetical protein